VIDPRPPQSLHWFESIIATPHLLSAIVLFHERHPPSFVATLVLLYTMTHVWLG